MTTHHNETNHTELPSQKEIVQNMSDAELLGVLYRLGKKEAEDLAKYTHIKADTLRTVKLTMNEIHVRFNVPENQLIHHM